MALSAETKAQIWIGLVCTVCGTVVGAAIGALPIYFVAKEAALIAADQAREDREADREDMRKEREDTRKEMREERLVAKEEERKERDAPKIDAVVSRAEDIWFNQGSCHTCHGERPMGGKVFDWENRYAFRLKTTTPVTITSATVEVYRVKLLQRHYTLSPTTDVGRMEYRPVLAADPRPSWKECTVWQFRDFRPEFKTPNIVLADLKDEKHTLPSVQLGQIDVSPNETISLTFTLEDDFGKQVGALRQSLVQVLAMVDFHTDKGISIRSEPFLISLRAPWTPIPVSATGTPEPVRAPVQ